MQGPQNGDSTRVRLEGQAWTWDEANVTFDWSRLEGQAWTWDEANVTFDWSISGYLSLDCMLRALDIIGCMFGYCIRLGHWQVDYIDWLSWLMIPIVAIFPMLHCYICLGHWHANYIDWLSWLMILIVVIFLVLHCYICLGHWHAGYIDWSFCLA